MKLSETFLHLPPACRHGVAYGLPAIQGSLRSERKPYCIERVPRASERYAVCAVIVGIPGDTKAQS